MESYESFRSQFSTLVTRNDNNKKSDSYYYDGDGGDDYEKIKIINIGNLFTTKNDENYSENNNSHPSIDFVNNDSIIKMLESSLKGNINFEDVDIPPPDSFTLNTIINNSNSNESKNNIKLDENGIEEVSVTIVNNSGNINALSHASVTPKCDNFVEDEGSQFYFVNDEFETLESKKDIRNEVNEILHLKSNTTNRYNNENIIRTDADVYFENHHQFKRYEKVDVDDVVDEEVEEIDKHIGIIFHSTPEYEPIEIFTLDDNFDYE